MASILRGSDNLDSSDIVKDSTCESDIAPYNKGFKNYIINGNFDERYASTNNQFFVSKTISFKVPMRTLPTVTIPRVYNQPTDYDTGWGVYQSGLKNGMGGICIYKNITTTAGNVLAFDAIADSEL